MSKNRVNNRDMWREVSNCNTFENNNETAWGQMEGNLYVVYSYGSHFPMYIFDYKTYQWYGNDDKYSSTTSRHQSYARPRGVEITYFDTAMMRAIVMNNGFNETVQRRLVA